MAENLSKILDSQFIEEAGIVDFFYGPENQETVNKGQKKIDLVSIIWYTISVVIVSTTTTTAQSKF